VRRLSGVVISDKLGGLFGCCEFEVAAERIIAFLLDDARRAHIPEWLQYDDDSGWRKKILISTIPEIAPSMFAALCAAGWLKHTWFPKGSFVVSQAFIDRVTARREPRRGVGINPSGGYPMKTTTGGLPPMGGRE
jgi:hypothetical protein